MIDSTERKQAAGRDWVDWTPQSLAERIAETEWALVQLSRLQYDDDRSWIRSVLEGDLDKKRTLLSDLATARA